MTIKKSCELHATGHLYRDTSSSIISAVISPLSNASSPLGSPTILYPFHFSLGPSLLFRSSHNLSFAIIRTDNSLEFFATRSHNALNSPWYPSNPSNVC